MGRYIRSVIIGLFGWALVADMIPKLHVNIHCEWSVRIGKRDAAQG